MKRWRLLLATVGSCLGLMMAVNAQAAVPDISEWQGTLTGTQVKSLKKQVSFVINRVQYGSNYEDIHHSNNESLYVKYGVPFGSYDFSTFYNASTAKAEAKKFYQRANKNTKFYVLDFEAIPSGHTMTSAQANAAVKAWYTEMRKLTNKHLIFYSYQSFAESYANTARKSFDAQWIANYTTNPTIDYSLWQYTSSYYLSSLGQSVDNSLMDSSSVTKYHPLSWWLNKTTKYAYSSYKKGQYVFLPTSKKKYYNGTTIPSKVKGKYYKITKTKKVTTGTSKQLVYLGSLKKWLRSQDVVGYWTSQHRLYKMTASTLLYKDAALTKKSGKTLKKGSTYQGTVVKTKLNGKTYYRLKINGGYATAQIARSQPGYYESLPASKQIKTLKAQYIFKTSSFKKAQRKAHYGKNRTVKVVGIYKRSTGSRYFKTSSGTFISANKSYVQTK